MINDQVLNRPSALRVLAALLMFSRAVDGDGSENLARLAIAEGRGRNPMAVVDAIRRLSHESHRFGVQTAVERLGR